MALVSRLSGVPRPPLALPDALAHRLAGVAGALARLTRTPPLLNFSPGAARHLATGFRFGSDKAEQDLGLVYTPVAQAVAEHIAAFHPARRTGTPPR